MRSSYQDCTRKAARICPHCQNCVKQAEAKRRNYPSMMTNGLGGRASIMSAGKLVDLQAKDAVRLHFKRHGEGIQLHSSVGSFHRAGVHIGRRREPWMVGAGTHIVQILHHTGAHGFMRGKHFQHITFLKLVATQTCNHIERGHRLPKCQRN